MDVAFATFNRFGSYDFDKLTLHNIINQKLAIDFLERIYLEVWRNSYL